MKAFVKILLFGLITWVVPFIVSFFFFQGGQLTISETFFKSIMIVVSSIVGVVLTVTYFNSISKAYVYQGVVLGTVWLVVNLGIDLLLVNRGFFPMTYQQYFTDIGLRYLSIPAYTIGVGVAASNMAKRVTKTETLASETGK